MKKHFLKTVNFFINTLKLIVYYFACVKFFFKPEFRTKSYNLHFLFSFTLGFVVMLFLFETTPLIETPFWFHIVVGAGLMFTLNFAKEWVWDALFQIEHDMIDVFFGSYGGILSGIASSIVYPILFL